MRDTDIICGCNQISVGDLTNLANTNVSLTKEDIVKELGLGTKCGTCLDRKRVEADTKVEVFYEDVLAQIGRV